MGLFTAGDIVEDDDFLGIDATLVATEHLEQLRAENDLLRERVADLYRGQEALEEEKGIFIANAIERNSDYEAEIDDLVTTLIEQAEALTSESEQNALLYEQREFLLRVFSAIDAYKGDSPLILRALAEVAILSLPVAAPEPVEDFGDPICDDLNCACHNG